MILAESEVFERRYSKCSYRMKRDKYEMNESMKQKLIEFNNKYK